LKVKQLTLTPPYLLKSFMFTLPESVENLSIVWTAVHSGILGCPKSTQVTPRCILGKMGRARTHPGFLTVLASMCTLNWSRTWAATDDVTETQDEYALRKSFGVIKTGGFGLVGADVVMVVIQQQEMVPCRRRYFSRSQRAVSRSEQETG